MLSYAEHAKPGATAIPSPRDRHAAPAARGRPRHGVIAANEAAVCRFMKMITLPKLRDALRDGSTRSGCRRVAVRARVPIERMVAIS